MRKLIGIVFAGLAAVVLASPAVAGDVEVKGPHICCKQCVKVVGKILDKVEGVSDASCDIKTKTITFKAKDSAVAKAAVKALVDGGFYGKATEDGKAIKLGLGKVAKGDKLDKVTVKGVHVCCGQCEKALKNLFKDSTVTFDGSGPQRTVIISGGELYLGDVRSALHKAGFNGSFAK